MKSFDKKALQAGSSWREERPPRRPVLSVSRQMILACAVILRVSVATATAAPASRLLTKYPLRDAVERQAVCLDGSVPQYYYRPPPMSSSTAANASQKVVLYFMHGGFCGYDLGSCARSVPYYSPASLPASIEGYHLLSPFATENPYFYDFGHLLLDYCSGDFFMLNGTDTYTPSSAGGGGAGASPSTTTLHFRGSNIVRSIVEDLRDGWITGTSAGSVPFSEVLLAGSSAGGIAVMNHAWRFQQTFENSTNMGGVPTSSSPGGAVVRAIIDSSQFFSIGGEEQLLAFVRNYQPESGGSGCVNDPMGLACCCYAFCMAGRDGGYFRNVPTLWLQSKYDFYSTASEVTHAAQQAGQGGQSGQRNGDDRSPTLLSHFLHYMAVAGRVETLSKQLISIQANSSAVLSTCAEHVLFAPTTLKMEWFGLDSAGTTPAYVHKAERRVNIGAVDLGAASGTGEGDVFSSSGGEGSSSGAKLSLEISVDAGILRESNVVNGEKLMAHVTRWAQGRTSDGSFGAAAANGASIGSASTSSGSSPTSSSSSWSWSTVNNSLTQKSHPAFNDIEHEKCASRLLVDFSLQSGREAGSFSDFLKEIDAVVFPLLLLGTMAVFGALAVHVWNERRKLTELAIRHCLAAELARSAKAKQQVLTEDGGTAGDLLVEEDLVFGDAEENDRDAETRANAAFAAQVLGERNERSQWDHFLSALKSVRADGKTLSGVRTREFKNLLAIQRSKLAASGSASASPNAAMNDTQHSYDYKENLQNEIVKDEQNKDAEATATSPAVTATRTNKPGGRLRSRVLKVLAKEAEAEVTKAKPDENEQDNHNDNGDDGIRALVRQMKRKMLSSEAAPEGSSPQENFLANLPCMMLQNVTYQIGSSHYLLANVNCVFRYGRMIALMGGSGSGKSTLCKLASDRQVEGRYSGLITLDGVPMHKIHNRTGKIAYVRQFPSCGPEACSVIEAILLHAYKSGLDIFAENAQGGALEELVGTSRGASSSSDHGTMRRRPSSPSRSFSRFTRSQTQAWDAVLDLVRQRLLLQKLNLSATAANVKKLNQYLHEGGVRVGLRSSHFNTTRDSEDFFARLQTIIQDLNMGWFLHRRIRDLSGGQKKLLSVAQALVTGPGIVYLDEPTSGLDAMTAETLMLALSNVTYKQKCCMVVVIHQPSPLVYSLFDDLVLLCRGKVIYSGPRDRADETLDALERKLVLRHQKPVRRTTSSAAPAGARGGGACSSIDEVGVEKLRLEKNVSGDSTVAAESDDPAGGHGSSSSVMSPSSGTISSALLLSPAGDGEAKANSSSSARARTATNTNGADAEAENPDEGATPMIIAQPGLSTMNKNSDATLAKAMNMFMVKNRKWDMLKHVLFVPRMPSAAEFIGEELKQLQRQTSANSATTAASSSTSSSSSQQHGVEQPQFKRAIDSPNPARSKAALLLELFAYNELTLQGVLPLVLLPLAGLVIWGFLEYSSAKHDTAKIMIEVFLVSFAVVNVLLPNVFAALHVNKDCLQDKTFKSSDMFWVLAVFSQCLASFIGLTMGTVSMTGFLLPARTLTGAGFFEHVCTGYLYASFIALLVQLLMYCKRGHEDSARMAAVFTQLAVCTAVLSLFSGFTITLTEASWLQFLIYLSPPYYAQRKLVVKGFRDETYDCENAECLLNSGNAWIAMLYGSPEGDEWVYFLLLAFCVATLVLARACWWWRMGTPAVQAVVPERDGEELKVALFPFVPRSGFKGLLDRVLKVSGGGGAGPGGASSAAAGGGGGEGTEEEERLVAEISAAERRGTAGGTVGKDEQEAEAGSAEQREFADAVSGEDVSLSLELLP